MKMKEKNQRISFSIELLSIFKKIKSKKFRFKLCDVIS